MSRQILTTKKNNNIFVHQGQEIVEQFSCIVVYEQTLCIDWKTIKIFFYSRAKNPCPVCLEKHIFLFDNRAHTLFQPA